MPSLLFRAAPRERTYRRALATAGQRSHNRPEGSSAAGSNCRPLSAAFAGFFESVRFNRIFLSVNRD